MPHRFGDAPGAGGGVPALWRGGFVLMPTPTVPGAETPTQKAWTWLLLSSAAQSDSSLLAPGRCRAEIPEFWDSFGSSCCIALPPLCHSAWFGAHNFLLDHPLRLVGLSSPGAPRSLSRPSCCWAPGLGIGLVQRGPGSEPLVLSLRRPSSLCHGAGRLSARTAAYTAGTCVSSVSLLLMSTSCSSHVASVFPDGRPLLVGAAGTTGKRGARLGWRGQGSQPLTLLSRLEMCLLQSACSCHPSLPVCQLSASLQPCTCISAAPSNSAGKGRSPQASSLVLPPGSSHSSFT